MRKHMPLRATCCLCLHVGAAICPRRSVADGVPVEPANICEASVGLS